MLPYGKEHDIGVLVYSPLAHGLLGGQVTVGSKFSKDDWRAGSSIFNGDALRRNLDVVARLRDFAEKRSWELPQLAVAWTLAHPAVDVAIVGARGVEQIEETARATDISLAVEDLEEIDAIVRDAAPVAPPGEVPGLRADHSSQAPRSS